MQTQQVWTMTVYVPTRFSSMSERVWELGLVHELSETAAHQKAERILARRAANGQITFPGYDLDRRAV